MASWMSSLENSKQILDFVTVTFGEELGLLQLQARSFARYMPPGLVGQIVVVVNEGDDGEAFPHIREHVVPLYGCHAPKVLIVERSKLCGDYGFKHSGWISQQVLKLLAGRLVQTKSYVVLDTKNHFTRPLKPKDFWASNGKLKHRRANLAYPKRAGFFGWLTRPKPGKLPRRYVGSMAYFGLDPNIFAAACVPKTTPFPLNAQLVRELIDDIEEREGVGFPQWFEAYFEATEFYLVQSYAAYRGYQFEDIYEPSKSGVLVLYPEAKKRLANVKTTLRDFGSNDRYFCLGVHRKLAPCLTQENKQALTDFWLDRGLIEQGQDFDQVLSPPASVLGTKRNTQADDNHAGGEAT